ncbi:MAG: NADH:flavin oxidoreductase [Deltaproteobacteria bacterium]|nr:NADH:flavin oxidoreductase [Deltaproteobacteria bacterium]
MYEELFEPIKIGAVEIKNRIAEAPMNQQGDRFGHPTKQYICAHNARALGGFGLIIAGAILTDKSAHEEYPFIPYLYPGCNTVGFWGDFTDSIRSQGTDTKVFAQMCIGIGRQGARPGCRAPSDLPVDPAELMRNEPAAARAWFPYFTSNFAKHLGKLKMSEFTIDQIKEAEHRFVRSCELAILAGFDGIEIHACHGYLMHTFLTPRSNQRTDEYGGSPANRARLQLNLVKGCKASFGDAVPVTFRISAQEFQEGGLSAEDVRQICVWAEGAGADGVHFSQSSGYDDQKNWMTHKKSDRDCLSILESQGKKLKQAVRMPVITVGLHSPSTAARAIAEGQTDMISLGRASIADPAWPNKVKEGRVDEINACTKCMYCLVMGVYSGRQFMRCMTNSTYGVEEYDPKFWPKPVQAKIPESLRRWKPGLRWKDQWDVK